MNQLKINRASGLALLAGLVALPLSAQFGGRENEAVVYLFSKGKMEFSVPPAGTTNAGIAGRLDVIDPATVPFTPMSTDLAYAPKRVKVFHKESGDLFELMVQSERTVTPRQRVVSPAKILTLGGLLRDDNLGSVSLLPIDVTGGIYVPFIPSIALGPDQGMDTPQWLFWTPSDSSPIFVQVPFETHSGVGPAGATGIEFQAFEGISAFFLPWENMRRLYGQDWPLGADLKRIDPEGVDTFFNPPLGNTARMLRLRPGISTPQFRLTTNTHFYVLEGSVTVTSPGGANLILTRGYYAFVPAGFSLTVANPRVFSPSTPPGSSSGN